MCVHAFFAAFLFFGRYCDPFRSTDAASFRRPAHSDATILLFRDKARTALDRFHEQSPPPFHPTARPIGATQREIIFNPRAA